jgi:antirestriction protein
MEVSDMTAIYENDKEERAAFLKAQGDLGKALLKYVYDDLEEAKRLMKACYLGAWWDEEAFAREMYEERANIAKVPYDLRFPDYEQYARHLFTLEYFCIEADKRIHVFLND